MTGLSVQVCEISGPVSGRLSWGWHWILEAINAEKDPSEKMNLMMEVLISQAGGNLCSPAAFEGVV